MGGHEKKRAGILRLNKGVGYGLEVRRGLGRRKRVWGIDYKRHRGGYGAA